MRGPIDALQQRFEANPELGPKLAVAGCVLVVTTVPGAAIGESIGAVRMPDTSEFDQQVRDLEIKINREEQAIDQLEEARPDTDAVITATEAIITGQRQQIQAIQGDKQAFIDQVNPHGGEYMGEGALAGLLVGAVATGVLFWRDRRARAKRA